MQTLKRIQKQREEVSVIEVFEFQVDKDTCKISLKHIGSENIPTKEVPLIGKRTFCCDDKDSWCEDETQEHLNLEMQRKR